MSPWASGWAPKLVALASVRRWADIRVMELWCFPWRELFGGPVASIDDIVFPGLRGPLVLELRVGITWRVWAEHIWARERAWCNMGVVVVVRHRVKVHRNGGSSPVYRLVLWWI